MHEGKWNHRRKCNARGAHRIDITDSISNFSTWTLAGLPGSIYIALTRALLVSALKACLGGLWPLAPTPTTPGRPVGLRWGVLTILARVTRWTDATIFQGISGVLVLLTPTSGQTGTGSGLTTLTCRLGDTDRFGEALAVVCS